MPVFFSSPAVCATALHCFSSSSPAIRQSQHSRVRLSSPEVPAASRFTVRTSGLCLFTASPPQLGLFIVSQLFITGTTDGTDSAKHALSPHLRRRKRGEKLSRKKQEQMHKAACNQEPVTMPTEACSKECVG